MSDRKEYHDYVDSIASDALTERNIKTKTDYEEYRDDIYDSIHESVDESQWIIYNARNWDVLQFTNNRDAWEEFGELPTDKGLDGIITFCAFCAMHADCMDELTRLVDNLPEDIEEEEESPTA